MKWYGKKNLKKSYNKFLIHRKKRYNLKTKSLNFYTKPFNNLKFKEFLIYLPCNWDFLYFKNSNELLPYLCFFYSPVYFFFLPINKEFINFFFDSQTKVLRLYCIYNNNFFNLFWNFFKWLFYSFSIVFFKKMKFKGKGYYVYKNFRNTIALQFGFSHKIRIFTFFLSVKFLSKASILFFGINKKDLNKITYHFKSFRPINIFTGKGIRFNKQIIYKKVGKVSSYR